MLIFYQESDKFENVRILPGISDKFENVDILPEIRVEKIIRVVGFHRWYRAMHWDQHRLSSSFPHLLLQPPTERTQRNSFSHLSTIVHIYYDLC